MAFSRTKPFIPAPQTTDLRTIVEAIRNIFRLRLDAAGEVTLAINVATTVVADLRVGINSGIVLMPVTANAAVEVGTIYVSSTGSETFTLTHANNATADRTFRYIVMG